MDMNGENTDLKKLTKVFFPGHLDWEGEKHVL
jgi:hypothetical protein